MRNNLERLVPWARFLAYFNEQDEDGGFEFNTEDFDGVNLEPWTLRIEQDAWKIIKVNCEAQLNQFETSLKEDQGILKDNETGLIKLSLNQKNCIKFRLGEKMQLQQIIGISNKIIDLCKLNLLDALKLNIDDDEELGPYLHYIKNEVFSIME